MKRTNFLPLCCAMLLFLPSCSRLIEWGKSNFYQGEEVELSNENIKPFIKSVTMYDQLQTDAHFDVMWLSDDVRTAYSQLHINRLGKDEEKYFAFLRRQLEENNHYISFYVLTTHGNKLGTPEAHWSFFLRLNGVDYLPFELKEIELPYEYQQLFGKKWNQFKVPYLMKFRRMDENEQPLLTQETIELPLYARSAKKETIFTWYPHGKPMAPVVMPQKKKKEKKIKLPPAPRKKRSGKKRKGV